MSVSSCAESGKRTRKKLNVRQIDSIFDLVHVVVMDPGLIVVQTVDRNPFRRYSARDRCPGVKTVRSKRVSRRSLVSLLSSVFSVESRVKCCDQDSSDQFLLLSHM